MHWVIVFKVEFNIDVIGRTCHLRWVLSKLFVSSDAWILLRILVVLPEFRLSNLIEPIIVIEAFVRANVWLLQLRGLNQCFREVNRVIKSTSIQYVAFILFILHLLRECASLKRSSWRCQGGKSCSGSGSHVLQILAGGLLLEPALVSVEISLNRLRLLNRSHVQRRALGQCAHYVILGLVLNVMDHSLKLFLLFLFVLPLPSLNLSHFLIIIGSFAHHHHIRL